MNIHKLFKAIGIVSISTTLIIGLIHLLAHFPNVAINIVGILIFMGVTILVYLTLND